MNTIQLVEAVTKTKYNKYMKHIDSNPDYIHDLLNLDFSTESTVKSFVEKVFGKPSVLYKNTFEEQHKVLRRVYDEKKRVQGDAIRSEFTEL